MTNRPLDVLSDSLNSSVIIRLKGGREYRAELKGYDIHMNLTLSNVEEIVEGGQGKKFKEMVVRGDTVVFVSPPSTTPSNQQQR